MLCLTSFRSETQQKIETAGSRAVVKEVKTKPHVFEFAKFSKKKKKLVQHDCGR